MLAQLPLFVDDGEVKHIKLTDLDISPFNVRKQNVTADLDALAASLQEFGLLQPIVVQSNGSRYDVVVGQRRYLAAKQLRWDTVPAFVLERQFDREQSTILSLSENIQRRDLSARDQQEACAYLLERLGTISKVAEALDVSTTTVRRWLGYHVVPEPIKVFVDEGRLSRDLATRIASHVENVDTAIAIAEQIASENNPVVRARVLESADELPGRSAETILRRAEEKSRELRLTIHLPESAALAIGRASDDEQIEPEAIALNATLQWLRDNRYLS